MHFKTEPASVNADHLELINYVTDVTEINDLGIGAFKSPEGHLHLAKRVGDEWEYVCGFQQFVYGLLKLDSVL
jgi:hypothetical protein